MRQSVSGENSKYTVEVLRFCSVSVDVVGTESVNARYSRDVPERCSGAMEWIYGDGAVSAALNSKRMTPVGLAVSKGM